MTESGMGERSALVLNYYQPWTYAGSERFVQLAREELRQGRSQAFVYVADAGGREQIDRSVRLPEYARLALYEYVESNRARPVSPYAVKLSGPGELDLEALVKVLRPRYVRAHFPAKEFLSVLDTAAFRRLPFVYDIMDLWDDFVMTPWGDRATEADYVKRADALIVVSRLLLDRFTGSTPAYLVPNAVDQGFLRRIAPTAQSSLRSPDMPKRALYMGSMGGSWFDWHLIHHVVRELPDHEFTFLGSPELPPEELHVGRLNRARAFLRDMSALPNVRVAAEVPHDDLVPWLCEADVGLIPFLECDLVKAVSPLKVYEYLGAGAPVVQIGMPDIAPYPGVRTAASKEEFVELVRMSDRAKLSPEEASVIAGFARENTWATRVARFDEIIAGLR